MLLVDYCIDADTVEQQTQTGKIRYFRPGNARTWGANMKGPFGATRVPILYPDRASVKRLLKLCVLEALHRPFVTSSWATRLNCSAKYERNVLYKNGII